MEESDALMPMDNRAESWESERDVGSRCSGPSNSFIGEDSETMKCCSPNRPLSMSVIVSFTSHGRSSDISRRMRSRPGGTYRRGV
eukprot:scaffold210882_cov35-Tisochrysis_lutea.AAC.1